MTFDSSEMGKFLFVKLSALRAAQLIRGCTPKITTVGKRTTTAQREVAGGHIIALPRVEAPIVK